ncbi:helix-turn-helix domain-containing protein, partial [Acinetobacter baumannii]|nr:helix-turn-helix domain-containing protein [Acinetobacter baumannii]
LVERIATDAGSRRRTQKEVAISLDLSPSFMSQLLAGKRMGDDVARKIESALGLPYGVMDVPEGVQTGTPSRGSHVLRLDPETIA